MKWINEPDSYASRPILALEPEEAETIALLLKKTRNETAKRFDHYCGLHEVGEATERQQTLMVKYGDLVDFIDNFTDMMK